MLALLLIGRWLLMRESRDTPRVIRMPFAVEKVGVGQDLPPVLMFYFVTYYSTDVPNSSIIRGMDNGPVRSCSSGRVLSHPKNE